MKLKKILNALPVLLIASIAVVGGFFMGSELSIKLFPSKTLSINASEIMEDASLINIEGKTPDMLKPYEVFMAAYYKLDNSESYDYTAIGTIETSVGITQKAFSRKAKDGDTYYNELGTYSSMIKKATRCSFKKGENIKLEIGSPTDENLTTINYQGKYENYTYEEYCDLNKREATIGCGYITSSKTVTAGTLDKIENNNYTFTLVFEPTLATLNYIYEIAATAGSDVNTIEFLSLTVTFTVDKNFNLIKQDSFEEYKMKYAGIGVTIKGTYNTIF